MRRPSPPPDYGRMRLYNPREFANLPASVRAQIKHVHVVPASIGGGFGRILVEFRSPPPLVKRHGRLAVG